MKTPDEHSADVPAADPGRAVLEMPDAWRFAYERISEGHTAAVLGQMENPDDPQARALLLATSAAVRAFRQVYEKTRTAGIAAQINALAPEGFPE
jgi:hypothetical protein